MSLSPQAGHVCTAVVPDILSPPEGGPQTSNHCTSETDFGDKLRLRGLPALARSASMRRKRRQAFGTKSREEALAEKVFGKTVTVRWEERDRYKRMLGHVLLDDR